MAVKIILAAPIVIGLVLVFSGIFLYIRRTKLGIQTEGTITGTAKGSRKYARLKMETEAPVVRYTVKGVEYNCPASKFQAEGVNSYPKGSKIKIRVSRRNPHRFEPVQGGGTAELLLIVCGGFMVFAYIIMYLRYFR
ncbi:MAG: DUF3592 domain-containing protein [Porcipelethomonas sp.]